MKYVALLSGGKDSCYNLLHCARNGHELVAAASLGPEPGKEELDSYMYQTVGQDAIILVAQALEVPLYRQVITGSAVEQGSEYGGRRARDAGGIAGDETEDLFVLLSKVKEHHPDVQGVSVGAILSNYQRVRVEHVCRRLNLTTLAYLWQRDQAELMSEMVQAGMEAIIIKVAGIGLTTKHLGKTLAQMHSTLIKLNDLYGSHICGEGGEYETFTLGCPIFKSRIVLTSTETVVHSDNDFATVAYLRMTSAHLEKKDLSMHLVETSATAQNMAVMPSLLDEDFQTLREALSDMDGEPHASNYGLLDDSSYAPLHDVSPSVPSVGAMGTWVAISQVEGDVRQTSGGVSIEDEIRACFETMKERLQEKSLSLHHIASMVVLLSDMSFFPTVNSIYASYFGSSPPARACVAVDLPKPIRIRLECLARQDPKPGGSLPSRQALHVQGLSYWAPANIGPYSQAILVDEQLFISGQIGLIPASLMLPSPRSLADETALCFQHASRIGAVIRANSGGQWNGHSQAIVYWLTDARHTSLLRRACASYEVERQIPTLFVVVKSLPRDALVEKQVLAHTCRVLCKDEDDDEEAWSNRPSYEHSNLVYGPSYDLQWAISGVQGTSTLCAFVCVRVNSGAGHSAALGGIAQLLKQQTALTAIWSSALAVRLFSRTSTSTALGKHLCIDLFKANSQPAVTTIPCRSIESTGSEITWDFALYIIAT